MTSQLNPTLLELLKRHREKRLSHFYTLSLSKKDTRENHYLKTQIQSFLIATISESRGINIDRGKEIFEGGHGDYHWSSPPSLNKNYSLTNNDLGDFFKFLSLSHFEQEWRFAVIDSAHLLTTAISNKLLKSLEEPTQRTTIFILNPWGQELLSTISSRAISLTLQDNEKQEEFAPHSKSFKDWACSKENTLTDYNKLFPESFIGIEAFINEIKSAPSQVQELEEFILSWSASYESSYQLKSKSIEVFKDYQLQKTFNNSIISRLTSLISLTFLTK